MTKTAKTTKAKTSEAPAADTTKEAPARDRFNCRATSQAATINAALSSKPKTTAEVATATGLSAGRVRSHLRFLVERGFAVESEAGFAIKATKAKK